MEAREQKILKDELRRWSDTCRSVGETKTADLIGRALMVLDQNRISPRIATELTSCAADYEQKPHKTYLVGVLRQTAARLEVTDHVPRITMDHRRNLGCGPGTTRRLEPALSALIISHLGRCPRSAIFYVVCATCPSARPEVFSTLIWEPGSPQRVVIRQLHLTK